MSTNSGTDAAQPSLLKNQDAGDDEETQSLDTKENELLYAVEDVPPWYLSLFFGFQHYLTMAGGTIAIPVILSSYLCIAENDPARGALVSTVFFHSGIVTLLQTIFGIRLPIIQGGDFAYLVPTIALLTTSHAPCSALPISNMTAIEREEVWHVRMRDVQGSLVVASFFQIILGMTGVIGLLLPWITPLTIVPTVSLVGLSLFDVAARQAAQHWGMSTLTMTLMVVFSQYLRNVTIPFPIYSPKHGFFFSRFRIFMCFPVLLAMFIAWSICWILTITDVFPEDSLARTDIKASLLENTPWFRVPYPGQWGMPSIPVAGVVGMMTGSLASIIESIGDYYACARIAGAPKPPVSAINRGIGIEGIGCLLAGFFGTGNGTTSCSQNIGAIGVTKVGSRRVVQYSALILIAAGLFGKLGALFVSIPDPVVAGVFTIMFAMITAVGLTPLQCIDLNSSRNLFVLGYSIFFGLALPKWLENNPGAIQTGFPMLDQTLTIVLQIPMFVGGFIGCLLDNTVRGSDRERGLLRWNDHLQGKTKQSMKENYQQSKCYDLPIGMSIIKRAQWLSYIPFSPTFTGFRRSEKVSDEEADM